MRVIKLAELLSVKYAINADELEQEFRRKIKTLWNYPNKLFPILKACADSGASKAKNPHEKKAVAGAKFCKKLVDLIDLLNSNSNTLGLGEIREKLLLIVNLINDNKDLSFDVEGKVSKKPSSALVAVQFPHVSALISELIPIARKSDVKARDAMQSKARTGLSRILSFSNTLLENLQELEVMSPEKFTHSTDVVDINQDLPERFSPQRGTLSTHDIVDFIRQYGDQYGIDSTEDWEKVFINDPVLKEEMTTVINALNRGHAPRDVTDVKSQIATILKAFKDRQSNNAHLFEETE